MIGSEMLPPTMFFPEREPQGLHLCNARRLLFFLAHIPVRIISGLPGSSTTVIHRSVAKNPGAFWDWKVPKHSPPA